MGGGVGGRGGGGLEGWRGTGTEGGRNRQKRWLGSGSGRASERASKGGGSGSGSGSEVGGERARAGGVSPAVRQLPPRALLPHPALPPPSPRRPCRPAGRQPAGPAGVGQRQRQQPGGRAPRAHGEPPPPPAPTPTPLSRPGRRAEQVHGRIEGGRMGGGGSGPSRGCRPREDAVRCCCAEMSCRVHQGMYDMPTHTRCCCAHTYYLHTVCRLTACVRYVACTVYVHAHINICTYTHTPHTHTHTHTHTHRTQHACVGYHTCPDLPFMTFPCAYNVAQQKHMRRGSTRCNMHIMCVAMCM